METVANNDSWVELGAIPNLIDQQGPYHYILPVLFLIGALCYSFQHIQTREKFAVINPRRPFEFTSSRLKQDFLVRAKELLSDGFERYREKPFRINTDFEDMTVLPPHYANEIRNDPRLNFMILIARILHGHLPGFDGVNPGNHLDILADVAKTRLSTSLPKLTEPLSQEGDAALRDIFTDDTEWHEVHLKNAILQLVARLSSKVFLGDELCRNQDWLTLTADYTVQIINAGMALRMWLQPLRPIVHWFLPECRLLRQQVAEARRLIQAVIEKRKADKAAARAEGRPPPEFNDAIEWLEKDAKGRPYDPATVQLSLSFVAIHTTTDLLTQTILDLAQHPDFVERLRGEVVDVLGKTGWTKTSLYNMKLLDSAIKETQRVKPISMVSMRRTVLSPVTLNDGTVLDAGTTIGISNRRMWDPEVHEDPLEWKGDRFLRMREKAAAEGGKDNAAHLVSTSPDHLGFGYGQHACPGRFFAANEVKIALALFLARYELRLAEGSVPAVRSVGVSMNVDPVARVMVRRRKTAEGEVEI